jgi:competence protein ComEA
MAVLIVGVQWLRNPAIQLPPTDPGYRVAINTADADTLRLFHGVGPALANNIVTFREQHGPFQTIEELDYVPGIGPRTLQRIRPWIDLR